MAELMSRSSVEITPFAPGVEVDERSVRRQLREQVGRLEAELSSLFTSTYPRKEFDWRVGSRGGPRLLSLGELEELRDDLVDRLQRNRRMLSDRTFAEERARRRVEEMMLAPAEYKWQRVTNAEIGEPGCKTWHVVPRLGPLGLLMGWWRVKISSGCPLPRGRGPWPSPRLSPQMNR